MKIVEVNKYAYLRRGAERHFLDVIDLLKRNGHTLSLFAMDYKRDGFENDAKYQVSYVGYNKDDSTFFQRLIGIGRLFWSFEARRKMKHLIHDSHPDIVHIHNIYHQLSPSILGPIRSAGIPIIMTVHDYNVVSPDKDRYYSEIGRHYWKFLFVRKYHFVKRVLLVLKKYWESWMQFYEKNIDGYIVPSMYLKNVLEQAGIEREKIFVIPHFISQENDKKKVSTEKKDENKKYAFYGGSISYEKGVDTLIDIFEQLQIPLVLAGTKEDHFIMRESSVVTFLGKQTKDQMTSLLENATCVVSGSMLPETFGLLALEAGSFGKPFFGFATGAFSEIVQDGKTGYLAHHKEMFQKNIADFFDGKMLFDATCIKDMTYKQFGEVQYTQNIERLFSSFLKSKEI